MLLTAAARIFGEADGVEAWAACCRKQEARLHLPPVFGRLAGVLGFEAPRARELFVFLSLRSVSSAAVRLGAVGPLQAQSLLHGLAEPAAQAVDDASRLSLDDLHLSLIHI